MTVRRRVVGRSGTIAMGGAMGSLLSRRLAKVPGAQPAAVPPTERTAVQQASSQLGAIVKLPKNAEDVLSSLLQRSRAEVRPPRGGTNIHVSDLISRCARKKAIVEKHSIPVAASRLTIMDALTYRQGEAIHDVIRERAAKGGPSAVWGKWKCRCGSLRVEEPCTFSSIDTSLICAGCESPTDEYVEVSFTHPTLQIVGHPDLLLWLEDLSAFYVTELKSISAERYKTLVRPDPDHIIQALFYWMLMRVNGRRVVDTVSILYITKGYTFRGVPYKEFTFNAKDNLPRLDQYLADAKAIIDSRKSDTLPARTMCAARESPDARSCEAAAICFGGGAKPVTVSIRQAQGKPATRR